jgi:hypothetical protein
LGFKPIANIEAKELISDSGSVKISSEAGVQRVNNLPFIPKQTDQGYENFSHCFMAVM